MKTVLVSTVCAAFLILSGAVYAEIPELVAGGAITSNGVPIKHTTPVPTVVDWNNDGMKDLIVGQFYSGNIYLFLNQGTNLNPVFKGSSKVLSGGTPITTTYG